MDPCHAMPTGSIQGSEGGRARLFFRDRPPRALAGGKGIGRGWMALGMQKVGVTMR